MSAMLAWCLVIAVGLALSALYSGLETGVYSLNRVRLHVLEHRGEPRARILRHLIDHPTAMLGTLLIGNNVANYMGTGGLAVILEAQGWGPWQTVLINVGLITPLLFIFGETLPKDLFAAHADRMLYPFARFLAFSRWLFLVTGLLPLVSGLTNLGGRLFGSDTGARLYHPRRLVTSLVKEGVGTGLLSEEQSAMVSRVMGLSSRTIRDEMVPWRKVIALEEGDGPETLWKLADRTSFSRFPVTRAGRVAGIVHVLDTLRLGRQQAPPPAELMRDPVRLAEQTPVRTALGRLQHEKTMMAIVEDGRGRPVGIVTVKDLVEPLTGELASW